MAERKNTYYRSFWFSRYGLYKKFSITAYGEYSYGYGNSDWWGETLSNVFTDAEDTYYNRYEKPCTPFKGWIYGVTLGFSFNL